MSDRKKAKERIILGAFFLIGGLLGVHEVYIDGDWEVHGLTSALSPIVSPIFVIAGIGCLVVGLADFISGSK